MLMLMLRRTLLVFVLLAAATMAFEPVIHTHPLTQDSSSQCAVCVNAHASLTTLVPATTSPLVNVGAVPLVVVPIPVQCADTPLASRAPPAA